MSALNAILSVLIEQRDDLKAALEMLDVRLRECIEVGLTAREAYDTYYQEVVSDAITRATGATP